MSSRPLSIVLAATVGTALALPVTAQNVDFSGQTIEIIVPASEGGGTDLWARFYTPLLQRYLPGEPTVVVRNMPGGGHTTGGNYFANNAQADGLMLLASSGTGHFNYLLGDGRVQYEFNDMRTIAASPVGGVMFVASLRGTDPVTLKHILSMTEAMFTQRMSLTPETLLALDDVIWSSYDHI